MIELYIVKDLIIRNTKYTFQEIHKITMKESKKGKIENTLFSGEYGEVEQN